ncbi:MAG: glycosyltransferase family 4 protein [Pseudomonas helleri]|jgi:polysaccharide biosynthesis protein PslH
MKILIISPDYPYPPNHGGRVDIWNRIVLLSELNHEVDLIITTQETTLSNEEEVEFRRHVADVTFIKRKKKILPFLFGIPYQISSRTALNKFKSSKKYDYIILESEATSPILDSPTVKDSKTLLRVHNNESKYYRSLFKSTGNIVKKIYYLYESLTYKKHSIKVKNRVDAILHISSDELSSELAFNTEKSFFLPPYINTSNLKEIATSKENKVIFIGNLFTANNINGLQWYLDNVHQRLLTINNEYSLTIAGNTRGGEIPIRNADQANITIIDSPKNLANIYKNAAVFIIPLLEGAGVKLRAINAISEGIPIVSTTTGIEGLGLKNNEHYLLGDSNEDFSLAINELLRSQDKRREIASNAQKHMIANLDSKKILSTILKPTVRDEF